MNYDEADVNRIGDESIKLLSNARWTEEKNADSDSSVIQRTDTDDIFIEKIDRKTMLHRTTNAQTLMHLLRCMIGTGILAMPGAFLSSGLWLGTGVTLALGIICLHCMILLVRSSQTLCKKNNIPAMDYGCVMETSLKVGSKRLAYVAKGGRNTVNTFLNLVQYGSCSVYILFVADNIKQVVDEYQPYSPDHRIYMLAITAFLIPFSFIKHLTILSIFMTFANIIVSAGLIIIAQYIVRDLPNVSNRTAVNSTEYLPLYFGTALFAFEGIGLVLPMENKMATPENFGGYCGVLTIGMTIAASLYTAMGFFGYLKLGDAVKGSITLNLPSAQWIYSLARTMFAVAILLSYGIQFYVPMTVVWPWIEDKIKRKGWKVAGEYIFRILSVLFTLLLAAVIPHLDLLISLIGALASTTLTIIFPPLIDILVQRCYKTLTVWEFIKNILLSIFGICGSVSGVIICLQQLIKRYQT